jgi:hypothetical protein
MFSDEDTTTMKWKEPETKIGTIFGMEIVIDSSLSPGQVLVIDSNGTKHVVDTSEDVTTTAWRLL